MTYILLTNGKRTARAPLGFSLPMALFGPLVPLLRRDWLTALCVASALPVLLVPGLWFPAAVGLFAWWPSVYNRVFIARHLSTGWRMSDEDANRTMPLRLLRLEPVPVHGNEMQGFGFALLAVCLASLAVVLFC